MFREDLEAAGIPCRDDSGCVVDFHRLRHTFVSNLATGGVHPKTTQAMARHSTIALTIDRYSHSYRDEQAAALTVLPDLPDSQRQAARATGTDDAQAGKKNLAFCLAQNEQRGSISRGADRPAASMGRSDQTHNNPCQSHEKRDSASLDNRRGGDSNPRYSYPHTGFRNQPLQPLGHLSQITFVSASTVPVNAGGDIIAGKNNAGTR